MTATPGTEIQVLEMYNTSLIINGNLYISSLSNNLGNMLKNRKMLVQIDFTHPLKRN